MKQTEWWRIPFREPCNSNWERYRQTAVNGKTRYLHRVVWEAAYGPIPDGLTIDHVCQQKGCTTLSHLEVVTRAENSRRARRGGRPSSMSVAGAILRSEPLTKEQP